MNRVKVRKYVDVHGIQREITFHREVPYLVPWSDKSAVSASEWTTEDGSIVRVPDKVWEEFNINYKDEYQ